jgi:putative addiction module killer protein
MRISTTHAYRRWFSKLKDETTKARINLRIVRLSEGNAGQHRNLTHGISELKLTFGAGYRVYYTHRNDELILLLIGGDKSTQTDDISTAIEIIKSLDAD